MRERIWLLFLIQGFRWRILAALYSLFSMIFNIRSFSLFNNWQFYRFYELFKVDFYYSRTQFSLLFLSVITVIFEQYRSLTRKFVQTLTHIVKHIFIELQRKDIPRMKIKTEEFDIDFLTLNLLHQNISVWKRLQHSV